MKLVNADKLKKQIDTEFNDVLTILVPLLAKEHPDMDVGLLEATVQADVQMVKGIIDDIAVEIGGEL